MNIKTAALSATALALVACTTQTEQDAYSTEAQDAAEIVVTGSRMHEKMADASFAYAATPVARTRYAPEPGQVITEKYEDFDPNPVKLASEEPVSTFSSDVDTTAYSVMRRYISANNALPPSSAVRVEEFLNYFDYGYAAPDAADAPFSPTVWVSPSPWRDGAEIVQIGVKGFDLQPAHTPAANIVLLLDVSGSMNAENKLPLVKKSIDLMLSEMSARDTVSVVVYAGAAGVVLEPTPGDQKRKILAALDALEAGGSTAGGEGLALAYDLAAEHFDEDKVNRVILATDGDFNVGVVDADSLEDFVARKRDDGVYLTVLGFGEGNYNDVVAQKLAQAGNGVAAYVDTLNEARKVLVREFRSTLFPIANDLKFQVEFNPAVVAEYRLIGYETRALNREDFNNDAVDAGDIGSGHTVTALYEIVRVGSKARLIDDRRYARAAPPAGPTDELAFVRLRYKLPGEEESRLIERPVRAAAAFATLDAAPRDARFAVAVAAFGQKLQRADHAASLAYEDIARLASEARGDDPFGQRAEFVNLVRAAAKIDEAG